MAFKDRISGMFRFGKAPQSENPKVSSDDSSAAEPAVPAQATEVEREELLQELGHGFNRVGNVLERLDQNLGTGIRSLEAMHQTQEQLPTLITEQQHLIRQAMDQASVTRNALEALTEHLQQRDVTQQAVIDRLEQIGVGMRDQRDAHERQLQLVIGFHRSSRFMAAMLMLGGFLVILLLLAALVVVLMRENIFENVFGGSSEPTATESSASLAPSSNSTPISSDPAPSTNATMASASTPDPIDTLITEAQQSADPMIAERAKAAAD